MCINIDETRKFKRKTGMPNTNIVDKNDLFVSC